MVLHKKQTVKNVPTNRKEKVYNKQYVFCFLDRAFSIMKTKNKPKNAQINSGLIYY